MESGVVPPDPSAEPGGLIVVVKDDPADAARAMAGDLGAELAVGGVETEAALDRLESRPGADRRVGRDGLEDLETAMRRAESILDRTRLAASERLTAGLNTRVAIHPDTIRRAAAQLLEAREAQQRSLADLRRRATRRRRALIALALAGVAGVVAGAGMAWAVSPVAGASVAAVAVVAAAGAAIGLFSARRTPSPLPSAPLTAALALAGRRWAQVAGTGADPGDVEAVIHRYDPQDPVVAPLVGEHPAVRAATRVVAQRREAWVAAWRSTVAERTEARRPTEVELLRQQKIELWLATPSHERSQPPALVVASPYAELSDERARDLHRRLHDLPPGKRVVVILGPEPSVDPLALDQPRSVADAEPGARRPPGQPADRAWASS